MRGRYTRTYYQKAQELNDTGMSDTMFYSNLLSFMSIRYFLGGLTSGHLSAKWLLQSNTDKMYDNILHSPFARYLPLLTVTYKGYDKYMR
jgi:hypothetical protein